MADEVTPDPLLRPKELIAELQIDKATFYRWRKKGNGPVAVRVGRTLRFRRSDVDAWLQTHREAS